MIFALRCRKNNDNIPLCAAKTLKRQAFENRYPRQYRHGITQIVEVQAVRRNCRKVGVRDAALVSLVDKQPIPVHAGYRKQGQLVIVEGMPCGVYGGAGIPIVVSAQGVGEDYHHAVAAEFCNFVVKLPYGSVERTRSCGVGVVVKRADWYVASEIVGDEVHCPYSIGHRGPSVVSPESLHSHALLVVSRHGTQRITAVSSVRSRTRDGAE